MRILKTKSEVLAGGGPVSQYVIGRTVGDIRADLKSLFQSAKIAPARVNGQLVTDDYVVKENDSLEFLRPAVKPR